MIYNIHTFKMKYTRKSGQLYTQFVEHCGAYKKVCCGFDIETTQTESHHAFMYIWQFSHNEDVILGRTWEEFQELVNFLSKLYQTDSKHKLLIWDHNFSFEWQFLKHKFNWAVKQNGEAEIFAMEVRKIVKAVTDSGIEFRDSLVLTGMSLAILAKNYCKTQKLIGDLDYNAQRNSRTELDEQELQYCINDVVILSEFASYIWNAYPDGNIPLTKTSIVRRDLKNAFKEMPKQERDNYKRRLVRAYPSENNYTTWMRWLYAGGWTHADFTHVGEVIDDPVESFDFKSSYPSSMFEKYPMQFRSLTPSLKVFKRWYERREDWALIVDVTFRDISVTGSHSCISQHKILPSDNKVLICADNGRVTYAEECRLILTEYDMESIFDFYNVTDDKMTINALKISRKEYLPKYVLDTVYSYFNKKETLPHDTIEYMLAKQNLNSIYGCCCSGLIRTSLSWNGIEFIPSDYQNEYWKVVQSQILLPQWGIWISAISRRNLLRIVKKISDNSTNDYGIASSDCLYGDTDSVKILNGAKHQQIIDEYNCNILRRNRMILDTCGYDLRELGTFQHEGTWSKSKYLGAKRYIYKEDDTIHCTIAGLPKKALGIYADKLHKDIFELFDNKLAIPANDAMKNAIEYTDEAVAEMITDNQGNSELMEEDSCACIFPIPFSMDMIPEYLEYIASVIDKHRYNFGIRGL